MRPNISYCVDRNDTHYNPYEIIMTQDSNAPMMNIAYKMGWCKSPYFMTKKEAESRKSIDIKTNIVSVPERKAVTNFDEIKYFTNATSIYIQSFSLTSINIPYNITTLSWGALRDMYKLENITIQNPNIKINSTAFCNDSKLKHFIILNGYTFIGDKQFLNCYGLQYLINYKSDLSYKTDVFNNKGKHNMYVPDEYVETYRTTEGWSDYADRIKPLSQFKNDFPDENIETDDINYGG